MQVPDVVGQEQAAAVQQLTTAGLTVPTTGITTEPSDTVAAGVVIRSDPEAGATVDEDTAVALVVSAGPNPIRVPVVVNLSEEDARANLEDAGFTGNVNSRAVDSLEPEGTVVSVDPAAGQSVPPDTTITLGISSGTLPLPDVRGLDQATAEQTLRDAGFTNVNPQNVERNDVTAGTVAGTEPGANTQLGAGDEITLLIAVPEPTETTSTPTTSAPATGSGIPIPVPPTN